MCELKSTLWAILKERICFFEKSGHKRTDAIELIIMSGCCWEIFRDEHGIKGKDGGDAFYKTMCDKHIHILEDSRVRNRIEGIEGVGENTYEEVTKDSAKRKFDSLNEIYEINHPAAS